MIAYLSGIIILKKDSFVILDINGIGYEVFLSASSIKDIPEQGEQLKLFTYLDVGERSLKLFGFKTYDELEVFKLVRSISGVGPKASLEISSVGSLETIKNKIEKNELALEKIPGIGQKKAQKIILELSGKLKSLEPVVKKPEDDFDETDEAFLALCNLGFPKDQCKKALEQVPKDIENQERIKQSLQILGK